MRCMFVSIYGRLLRSILLVVKHMRGSGRTYLKRGACEQQPPLCVEVKECLPSLRLEVLNVMGFVKDHIIPPLPPECVRVLICVSCI